MEITGFITRGRRGKDFRIAQIKVVRTYGKGK